MTSATRQGPCPVEDVRSRARFFDESRLEDRGPMEVFPIGPAGRFFDAERRVYVRTVRFGFFFAQVTRVSKKTVMCVCLSVCLSVCRARAGRDF